MGLSVDIKKRLGDFTLQVCFRTEGGVTGILGASGSGKSMTLRCIAGIERPDEGRIELDGTVLFDSAKKIHVKPQRRQVGLLFQNYALFPNMTVWQNLMAGLRSREKNRQAAAAQAEALIERFCLSGLEGHRPFQLSGGQQQRVALARILLSKPRMLMLDEPFSALDGYLKWNLELELSEVLREFGGSALFVSHSRNEIYRLCDQACVMDQGVSGTLTPVRQLFEAPVSRAAALLSGCKNYSRARLIQESEVYAQDWGLTLEYRGEAPEGFRYIGVRSHYIVPVSQEERTDQKNTFCCQILQAVEDVFSMVLILRPVSAPSLSETGRREEQQIRAEMPKELWHSFCQSADSSGELWVHIRPEDVMLLQ